MEGTSQLIIKGETKEIKGERERKKERVSVWLKTQQSPGKAQINTACSLLGKSWHDILIETPSLFRAK